MSFWQSLIGTFEMLRAFGVFDASKLRDKTGGAAEETAVGAKAKVTGAQAAGVFAFAAVCVPACALTEQYFSAGAFAAAAAFFLLALYLLALLPILIFYIICQKQILNGVVNGAVK